MNNNRQLVRKDNTTKLREKLGEDSYVYRVNYNTHYCVP